MSILKVVVAVDATALEARLQLIPHETHSIGVASTRSVLFDRALEEILRLFFSLHDERNLIRINYDKFSIMRDKQQTYNIFVDECKTEDDDLEYQEYDDANSILRRKYRIS